MKLPMGFIQSIPVISIWKSREAGIFGKMLQEATIKFGQRLTVSHSSCTERMLRLKR
jgi:hypothetical protein